MSLASLEASACGSGKLTYMQSIPSCGADPLVLRLVLHPLMTFQFPDACESILGDVRLHLGAGTPQYMKFLVLVESIISSDGDPHRISQSILGLAEVLKTSPKTFYGLNGVFHPHSRVEFNVQRSPITSFVLRTSRYSQIVVLGGHQDHLSLHDLSTAQLCDILIHGKSGTFTYDDLQGITDLALQDCLAQLAQDLLDDPSTPRLGRKQALRFLRRAFSVPPSLLLHGLTQRSAFAFTMMSDLYEGMVDNLKVVIKKPRIHKSLLDNNKGIIREIILCRQFQHPNVLPLLGASLDGPDRYGLVTRFMKNGNIIDFLQCNPDTNRLTPIWQIMNGLQFLHGFDPPVAHRDIKGANVLVDDDLVCRLCDFGLTSIPEMSQRSRDQPIGTLSWIAPELLSLTSGRTDLLKADVYSLGVTTIEIFTGVPPPSLNGTNAQHLTNLLKEGFNLHGARAWPPFFLELVSMMLDSDPMERPSVRLLCQALEDALEFPKTIKIGERSHELVGTQVEGAFDYASIKRTTQDWIQEELCLERRCAPAPIVEQNQQGFDILRPCAGPPVEGHDQTTARFAHLRQTASSTLTKNVKRCSDMACNRCRRPKLKCENKDSALPCERCDHDMMDCYNTPVLEDPTDCSPVDAHQPRPTFLQLSLCPRAPTPSITPAGILCSSSTTTPSPKLGRHDPSNFFDALSTSPLRKHKTFVGDELVSGEENTITLSGGKCLNHLADRDERGPSPSKRGRHDDTLYWSTPEASGNKVMGTDHISEPRFLRHDRDRANKFDWVPIDLVNDSIRPLDIQVFVNHSSHVSAPEVFSAFQLSSVPPSNETPGANLQVPDHRSHAGPATIVYRAPNLIRPSSLSPPSVSVPQVEPETRIPPWPNLDRQERYAETPISTQPLGSLARTLLSSGIPLPTHPLPRAFADGESTDVQSSRSYESLSSDELASPGPNNHYDASGEAPYPELGEPQPAQPIPLLQPAPQSPPSTYSQGSSTSSQSSSATLIGHVEVSTLEGKTKDPTVQISQETRHSFLQLSQPTLEDSLLPFGSDSGIFNHPHHFVVSDSTMWSVGTQHQHYHGHISILERLISYSMSGAEFDSRRREYPPRCHSGTRDGILTAIRLSLCAAGQQAQMIWISGPAGAGRSAIMQTLAESMPPDQLFAALFLSRNEGLNDATQVLPTIAYQLAIRSAPYRSYLEEKFKNDPMFLERSLSAQFRSLFIVPFTQRSIPLGSNCCPIFVDGLEECQTERDQCKILELVCSFMLEHPTVPITWVFATRMKQHLIAIFSRARTNQEFYREYHLSISSSQARGDVKRYLKDELGRIGADFSEAIPPSSTWPTREQFLRIASASQGFFAFASSIIDFIGDHLGNPVTRFHCVLDYLNGIELPPDSPSMDNPFRSLDVLYAQIMSDIPPDTLPQIKLLLGYYMSAAVPNSMKGSLLLACNILGFGPLTDNALQTLSPVLAVPLPSNRHTEGLRFLHRSFADYLRDCSRSDRYWIDPVSVSQALRRCYARIWLQWLKSRSIDGILLPWPANVDTAQLENGHNLRSEMFAHVSSLWRVLFYRYRRRPPLST